MHRAILEYLRLSNESSLLGWLARPSSVGFVCLVNDNANDAVRVAGTDGH